MSFRLAALLHDDDDNIVISGSRKTDGGKTWFNRSVRDTEQADRVAAEIAAGNRNVHCKHGLHDGTLNDQRRPNCQGIHFQSSRTFFIDIDVGHGDTDHYDTMTEAAAAFKQAEAELRKLGLPRPNIVQLTGMGIQAVWVTAEPYPGDEWRRLMGVLSLLAKRCGLLIDMGMVAIDKAVRYCGPGFFNVNHGTPLPTKVLHFDEQRIENNLFSTVLMQHGMLRSVEPAPKPARFNDRFKVNQDDFQLDLSLIVDECKVLQEAVLTSGKDHGYRHWTNLLGLISKNGDEDYGRLLAHEISKDHPDYDGGATDDKFDGFRASGVKGYTTCATFGQIRSDLCAQCSYYKKINSPAGIQGKIAAVATARGETQVVAGDGARLLDSEYFNSDAGVRRNKRGDETHNPIIWPKVKIGDLSIRQLDIDEKMELLCFNTSSINGSWMKPVEVPATSMSNYNSTMKVLSTHQIPIKDALQKGVNEALISWMQSLRERTERHVKYTRLGWTEDRKSFVLGSVVYHNNGTQESIFNPSNEMLAHDTRGDYANDYRSVVNAIMEHETRPEAHAFLAGSLGAVLLQLVGAAGIALNFYSARSGYGKSTLSTLAGSIWGNPRQLAFTLDDTPNSIMRRVSLLNNLPGLYDEIRLDNEGQSKVIDLVFRLAASMEKSRLDAASRLQERGAWCTFMLFSTNYNFTDIVRADPKRGGEAAVARVLDFALQPLPPGSRANAAKIAMELSRLNYTNGWVGHNFIHYVVNHQEAIRQAVHIEFKKFMAKSHSNNSDVFGRNHAFAGAVMLVAAHVAKIKNILPLNPMYVEQAVLEAIAHAKEARTDTHRDSDPMIVLRNFIREHEGRRFVIIKLGNKGHRQVDASTLPRIMPPMYEIDTIDKVVRVSYRAFIDYVQKESQSAHSVARGIIKYLAPDPIAFGAGTPQVGVPIEMLVFPPVGIFVGLFGSSNTGVR